MIYGTIFENKTILAGATTTEELKIFGSALIETHLFCKKAYEPDLAQLLQDEDLNGLSFAYVFVHKSNNEATKFVNHYNINILTPSELRDYHKAMVSEQGKDVDPYSMGADRRSIGEIYALEQSDPWDGRSEEEKQQDATNKEKAEKNKKDGGLTGDSFSADSKKSVAITDIHVEKKDDGTFDITKAIGVKFENEIIEEQKEFTIGEKIVNFVDGHGGKINSSLDVSSYPDDKFYVITSPYLKHAFMNFDKFNGVSRHTDSGACLLEKTKDFVIMQYADDAAKMEYYIKLIGHPLTIYVVNKEGYLLNEPTDDFEIMSSVYKKTISHDHGIYYVSYLSNNKVNETSLLGEIVNILKNSDQYKKLYSIGLDNGAWISSKNLMSLGVMISELTLAGYGASKPSAVDKDNNIIIEGDGASVIDTTQKDAQLPRPWNGRMEEFLALGDGDIEKAWKKVKGKELIYCTIPISRHDGVLIYITPAEYWDTNHAFWDGELCINHLLAPDMKPVEDSLNTWRSKSRDELSLNHSLISVGMGEPMDFTVFINNL